MDFLPVSCKKASDISIAKPLKNVLQSYYKMSDSSESYSEAINEFAKLRNEAAVKTLDRNDKSLEILTRYYDQLTALEAKIPPSEVQIPFKWKAVLDKGSFFGGRSSLTVSSLGFEKVCILFNIAALQSQMAASQNPDSDDGLKTAAKLFQQSSGVFGHLKGTVMSAIQQEPTPDLSPDALAALSALMLAQAQETFAYKSIKDRMKEPIIAKLCSQTEDYYAEALRLMQKETIRGIWEREWVALVAGKQAAYHGIASFYQGNVEGAKKNVGEQIARYQHAQELLKAAETRAGSGGVITYLLDYQRRVKLAYDEAKKDNDFIYHERITDVKNLSPVPKASLAKPTPLPDKMSQNFTDLFESLLPVPVHLAMTMYDAMKSETVNAEVAIMREGTHYLNSILASLNLPASLEDREGTALPQSLKEKAATIRSGGGLGGLETMMTNLPELLQRNTEILDEVDRLLAEEKQSDDQLRDQFKERWTRTPSTTLTEPLVANVSKYRAIIGKANDADALVRQKYDSNRKGLELLSQPEDQLIAAIPTASSYDDDDHDAVQTLRDFMEEVETIKAERDVIESEFKSATTDMKPLFLNALRTEGSVNGQALSTEALGQVYGPLKKQVVDSRKRQDALIARIQKAHEEMMKSRGGAENSRETLLKELATAYDVYTELKANLEEGTMFYNDLTQLLVNFQNKVTDFCFARKTEKEELMKDLTSNIANQRMPQAPERPPAPSRPPRARDTAATAPGAPRLDAGSDSVTTDGSSAPLPYPLQPPQNMPQPFAAQPMAAPYPYYTPMPQGYNPYATYPPPRPQQGYPQAPPGYPPNYAYPPHQAPPAYQGYPYPPQNQNPQWR